MLKVDEVNALGRHEFIEKFAPLFEHSPWIAIRTAEKRPFGDHNAIFSALRETVMKASNDEKLGLIRAHPDLVGREVLTRESQGEQKSAGLGELTPEEVGQFRKYNAEYREKFGFPFVICARLNKKEAILQAFPVRLQHAHEQEVEIALGEIFKIAELRLRDLVQ